MNLNDSKAGIKLIEQIAKHKLLINTNSPVKPISKNHNQITTEKKRK